MRLIIFGGSFNPIHLGHLQIAKNALKVLEADLVLFVLNNQSKNKEVTTPISDRWAMLNLAIADEPQMQACDIELKHQGVSYTIDTLKELHQLYPHDELFFLMGADQWAQIQEWKDYQELNQYAQIVVYPREDYPLTQHSDINAIFLSNVLTNDISSTKIKDKGTWVKDLPIVVNDYINEHGCYPLEHYKLFNISEKRWQHSLRTAQMAKNIMQIFAPEDAHLAWAAGVYHDVCKCESQAWLEEQAYQKYHLPHAVSWKVLHGPVAACYLPEVLNFHHPVILKAIALHTCPLDGASFDELSLLDKILFCCDKLEPCRTEEDMSDIDKYRELLKHDVDACFWGIINYLKQEYH